MADTVVRIITPGDDVYGYVCPKCGQKVLSICRPLRDTEKHCESCGSDLKETTLGREESVKTKPKKQKQPTPDGCKNCCFSRRNPLHINGKEVPMFKCFKDGRSHSPDALCGKHKRRGIILK